MCVSYVILPKIEMGWLRRNVKANIYDSKIKD